MASAILLTNVGFFIECLVVFLCVCVKIEKDIYISLYMKRRSIDVTIVGTVVSFVGWLVGCLLGTPFLMIVRSHFGRLLTIYKST